MSESVIKQAFERIGVSTELNRESVMGFAKISQQEEFIKEVPEEKKLFAE